MAILERLWVIHTTSTMEDADTDDAFSLELQTATENVILWFPKLPKMERVRGSTDKYEFDLGDCAIDCKDLTPDRIRITTHGYDCWLPKSIWIIGKTVDGEFCTLVARPDWPTNAWFGNCHKMGMNSRSMDKSCDEHAHQKDDVVERPTLCDNS